MPDLYSLVLFVHVLTGVMLVGTSLVAPRLLKMIRAARRASELERWLDFEHRLTKWNPAVALVLLATGVYLGSVGWWTQPWFYVSVAAWITNAALAGAIVGRMAQAMMQRVVRPGDAPVDATTDAMRRSATFSLAIGAIMANDIGLLYIMFNKPGLAGAVGVLLAANALGAAVALATRAREQKRLSANVSLSRLSA